MLKSTSCLRLSSFLAAAQCAEKPWTHLLPLPLLLLLLLLLLLVVVLLLGVQLVVVRLSG
jgi:hypothetical protein